MKKSLLPFLLFVVLFLFNSCFVVKGQFTLASWSFDGLIAPTSTVPTSSVINSDYGILSLNATAYLDGSNGSSSWISVVTNPELTTFAGSTLNDPRITPTAGNALAIANSSANGKSIVFKFSTLGYSAISISFTTRGTSTGFNTHAWEWSTDNSTYTAFGSNTANTTSTFITKNLNLTSITAVNNSSTVYIRLTVSGATSGSGNNRIDNFVVSALADIDAPIPTFNPLNLASDVAITVAPTITFNEPIFKTDGSDVIDADLATLLTFKKTDASGANVPFTATINSTKKVITLTPSSVLDNSQVYYLAIGPVKDAGGAQSSGSNSTFTTLATATPVVTLTYPAGGETLYAGDPVTFTWTSANVTSVNLEGWVPDHSTREYSWVPIVSGATASTGKYDFTIPADAHYGTLYKIRLSDASNSSVNSTSGTFTMIASAVSITDLKTNCIVDDIFRLNAEATISYIRPAASKQTYIQDSGAGIMIYDGSAMITGVATGDNIYGLKGKLSVYYGMFEVLPQSSSFTKKSSGNSITPRTVTIADFNSSFPTYESMLVKFTNVKFVDGNSTNTFAVAAANYNVIDGINTLVFRNFPSGEGDIAGSVIPDGQYNVTGLGLLYSSQPVVSGRTTSDFEFLTAMENTSTAAPVIFPVPAREMLTIRNISNIRHAEILDATGKVIRSVNVSGDNEINIPVSDLKKGMYFLRLTTLNAKVTSKFIK
jgi:hypothetical protein